MDKIVISQMVGEQIACVTQDVNLYDKLDCLLALYIPFKITPVSIEEFLLVENKIESNSLPSASIFFDRKNDSISVGHNGTKYDIKRDGKVINTKEVFSCYDFGENIMNIYTAEKYEDILSHFGFDVNKCGKNLGKSKKRSN